MSGPINLQAVRRAHRRFLDRHTKTVDKSLDWAGDFAADHVSAHSKFKRQSGADSLKDATDHKFLRTGSGAVVRIFSAKAYAPYVEYGTKPHVIRPRRKKFLRFVSGGSVVFARKVNHPGTPAFRFLYNATDAAHRLLGQKLTMELGRVARTF